MKDIKLEKIAEEYYDEGLDFKYIDDDKAMIRFSISYGFYRSMEDMGKANLCVEQLRSLGLPDEIIKKCREFGMDNALYCHNLVEIVEKVMSKR